MQTYTHYKDSGIDWIGQIPEHWEISKLGNILKPYSVKNKAHLPLLSITREKGVILRGDDPEESNHNFIPDDLSGYKHIKKGQFGMNKMKAWQGSYGYSNFEGIVSPAYYIFDISDKLYGDYFSKTIRSNAFIPFFIKASDGVRIGQWDLSKPRMKEIPFYIPPIHEQEAIAKFLENKTAKIDALVQTKEQQIEKLKEVRQAKIHQAVTKGLDAHAPAKDSGIEWIGEIPEHWEVSKVKNYLKIPITDGPHTTPILLDEGIPFISAEAIKNGKIDFNKKRGNISEEDYKLFSQKYVPQRNDIYMIKSGATTGNIAMVETDDIFTIWSPLAVFRSNHRILPKFLYNILQSSYFKTSVELSWSFGTQQNIGMGVLSNLYITIPISLKEQEQIVAHLDEVTGKIDQAIAQKQEQITKLKEYKQSLINDVVTGKVKVC